MSFRVKKSILVLSVLLLLNIIIYGISLTITNFGPAKYVVLTVLFILVLLNVVAFFMNEVILKEDLVYVKSLYGSRGIKIPEIAEISYIPLKGRILMMLSDKDKFVFVSSMMDGFGDIVEYLKKGIKDENLLNILNEVRLDVISHKNKMVVLFLIVLNIVVIGSYIYNFLL
ncbi:hypothetical protein [Calditerrivibrio nitroreducens]|uniref:Bacterial Pleckstrin homology domain-containing protein n=1 Tax=Calditerrivibrio nitroreducens TaxID=477976 RepID=A0A2J6WIV2_9BACT|nr:MAG: hypothetical protein C0187_05665 [Calditerrivibrio nitroreducens]